MRLFCGETPSGTRNDNFANPGVGARSVPLDKGLGETTRRSVVGVVAAVNTTVGIMVGFGVRFTVSLGVGDLELVGDDESAWENATVSLGVGDLDAILGPRSDGASSARIRIVMTSKSNAAVIPTLMNGGNKRNRPHALRSTWVFPRVTASGEAIA